MDCVDLVRKVKGRWFLRGVQSAIFYYLSCSPCADINHRRTRKNQAARQQKERAKIIMEQPGIIPQPMPFQTNRAWEEEILAGPGPPARYQRDNLGGQLKQKTKRAKGDEKKAAELKGKASDKPGGNTASRENVPPAPSTGAPSNSRPGHERKGSTVDALKDTLRITLHPERWNWIRYEREDEILSGAHDRLSSVWDKVTAKEGRHRRSEHRHSAGGGRPRADTNDSDQVEYDYYRARNPEVNEYHPPVVSQLPRRREEVAWIKLPPPSRAVMEGKVRPGIDSATRRALAQIGRTPEELVELRQARKKPIPRESPAPQSPEVEEDDDNLTSGTTSSSPSPSSVWEPPQRPPLAVITNPKARDVDWDYYGVLEMSPMGRQPSV